MFNLTVRNSIRVKKSRRIVYKWFGLELITVTADDSSFTIRGQRGIRSLGGEKPRGHETAICGTINFYFILNTDDDERMHY